MAKLPQIVFGTYEAFLIGYEIIENDDKTITFSMNMASHAHLGSIRSVTVCKSLLASAGSDEYVNVFNMVSRKELAVLTPHEGTVTSALFAPDGSHLITGSQDGNISIFRCTDWKSVKSWKGAHKKPNGVVGMAIHPTGKLLLSIGAEGIMRVWNMVKGRLAYAVNFSKKVTPGNTLNLVSWSLNGSHYALTIGNSCEVYETETAALIYTIKSESRISCLDLLMPSLVCVGRDDGHLEVHNYLSKEQILDQVVHTGRIKCLRLISSTTPDFFIVTADSNGNIRLWRWKRETQPKKLVQEAEVNADCRLVCMALLNPDDLVKKEETELKTGSEKISKTIIGDSRTVAVAADLSQDASTNGSARKKKKNRISTAEGGSKNASPVRINDSKKSPVVASSGKKRKRASLEVIAEKNSTKEKSPVAATSGKKRKSISFEVTSAKKKTTKARKSFSSSPWTVT